MFIRYFLELPVPFEHVETALLRAPQEWIPGLARDAEGRGTRLLTEVGFGTLDRRVKKEVAVELGEAYRIPSKTLLPIEWRATGAEGLFPSLEADIEVASLGPYLTQLSMSARYRPPMGAIGRALDRALLHRVAEATVKDFLDRVGEILLANTPAHG